MERHDDPFALLDEWYAEAQAREPDLPQAASLATVGGDGRPSNRLVLLNRLSADGFDFYTDTGSRKGRDLDRVPYAALVLHWKSLGRQIRIEGRVEMLPDSASDAYWEARPRGGQISARASEQSAPIGSRADLEAKRDAEEARYREQPVPRPPSWGGYRLTPDRIEFWQHRDDRLHDRVEYRRDEPGSAWTRTRLQP